MDLAAAVLVILFSIASRSSSPNKTMKSPAAVVDIVTGGSQGIGKAVAEYIADERSSSNSCAGTDYLLVLVGRSEQRGSQVQTAIQKENPNLQVVFESCDLSDWQSVQQLQERIASSVSNSHNGNSNYQVGILVNSAAECPKRQKIVERNQKDNGSVKLDKQFASNVLGYHFMMRAFEDHFFFREGNSSTVKTHIINVASSWAGDLDLNDINFQRRSYDNDSAYRQSKQCDRMLSKQWSHRLGGKALVNGCHPGDPCTTLSKDLGYNLFAGAPTRKQIARYSPFPYLCGLKSGHELTTTGGWFYGTNTKSSHCGFERLTQDRERLFELCESFCT